MSATARKPRAWKPGYFVVPLRKPCDPIHKDALVTHFLTSDDIEQVTMAKQYIETIVATDEILLRIMA